MIATDLSYLEHGQRKFEELSGGYILFSNLNEVYAKVHLIADDL
jgi:hypothetical protein